MKNTSTRFKQEHEQEPDTQTLLSNLQLQAILGIILAATVILVSIDWIYERQLSTIYAGLPLIIIILASYYLIRQGYSKPARVMVPLTALIGINYILITGGGVHDTSLIAYVAILLVANLTLSGNAALVFGFLVILSIVTIGVLEINGIVINKFSHVTDIADVLIIPTVIIVITGLLRMLVGRLTSYVKIAQQNEQAQIKANKELRTLQTNLEERISQRTNELSLRSTELELANIRNKRRAEQFEIISQILSSVRTFHSLDELLPRITDLISERFSFYHTGIFLNDSQQTFSILRAANSEGGQHMLTRGHRLLIGKQGIVGTVAATGEPRIAMDVGEDAIYFDNPDLPTTRSEMALPLKSGENIIGVLDVQSEREAAFDDEDIYVLSILADQVSIAIENSRLYDETQRSLTEVETLYRQYLRQAWDRVPKEQQLEGYQYKVGGVKPIQKEKIQLKPKPEKQLQEIAIPIALRGESIGTLAVQIPKEEPVTADQMDVIKAVADRVAISVENARLFNETTKRAERERLVSEITTKIRNKTDPNQMIQVALSELKKSLGATRVELVPHLANKTDESAQDFDTSLNPI